MATAASSVVIRQRKRPRQYWLVGAFHKTDECERHVDQYDKFIERGYWHTDFISEENITETDKICAGDRIAIKKKLGRDEYEKIEIRSIGIVTSVEDHVVYVDWIRTNMQRKVSSKGCYATIHGPFQNVQSPEMDRWLGRIFRI